jgi:Ser/Thr protein kinase RdoA (MazF antagonist)
MGSPSPPPELLEAWGLGDARWTRVASGWINATFVVEPRRFVLQRLNPIFGPEINEDIEAITSWLYEAGMITPRLVRTAAGGLHAEDDDGNVWRLMTYIEGRTLERADSPARCGSAGALVGRFHRALWSCDHVFRHRRPGIHDTPRHLAALRRALEAHGDHRLYGAIEPVGRAILAASEAIASPGELPGRVVHGDLKLTNIIFDAAGGEALCLVDLDTLARMPLPLEVGDALRSWCCPQGEDVEGPIEPGFYEAAIRGYAGGVGQLLPVEERRAIPGAVEQIAVELAARFCADALEESYFGWDRARFASAAEHNLQRARAQLSVARSVRAHLTRLRALTERAW